MKERRGLIVAARSKEGNDELQGMLAERGLEATPVETIRLDDPEDWGPVDGAIARIGSFDWVAFTSPRGVATFTRRLKELRIDPAGLGPKFAAVGKKTAQALKRMGVAADYVPSEFLTTSLAKGIPGGAGSRILVLRADIGDKRFVASLEERGFMVEDIVAYRTKFVPGPVEPELVSGARVVVFASPSEVEGFRRRLGGVGFREVATRATAACIGPVTAGAAEREGFSSVVFANEHTLEALVEKVAEMMVNA